MLRAGALLLAAAICATSGCGLPDARPDISPPEPGPPDDAFKVLRLTAPSSIAAPFLGVEVYYRFAGQNSPSVRGLESLEQVRSAGFQRLAAGDDRVTQINFPLIARPAAEVTVQLDFGPVSSGGEPLVRFGDQDGNERQVSLRRAVAESDGQYKRFNCDEFAAGDSDIGSVQDQLAGDCGTSAVRLQAYAFSYGRTPDGIAVHSDAVDLETIDVTFGRP